MKLSLKVNKKCGDAGIKTPSFHASSVRGAGGASCY